MSDDHRATLLVVDDDRFMQEFITDSLGEHYLVQCASSGEEALALARQQAPALMLVDVQMPEMDGYALCRAVKDDWDISDTPVLFLSALDGIDDRLRGFEVGGEDFVTKPVNPRVLQAKIARVLALQQERSQLKSQAQYATSTAMTAMTSMSETGLLLEVMKRFNQCAAPRELAQGCRNRWRCLAWMARWSCCCRNATVSRSTTVARPASWKSRCCTTWPGWTASSSTRAGCRSVTRTPGWWW